MELILQLLVLTLKLLNLLVYLIPAATCLSPRPPLLKDDNSAGNKEHEGLGYEGCTHVDSLVLRQRSDLDGPRRLLLHELFFGFLKRLFICFCLGFGLDGWALGSAALRLGFLELSLYLLLDDYGILEQADAPSHVQSVQALGELDASSAEGFVVTGIALDGILRENVSQGAKLTPMTSPTAIGFANVLMNSEPILRLSDMAAEAGGGTECAAGLEDDE